MMTNNKYSYISSSIVKEIGLYGGDISCLVPKSVKADILAKLQKST